MPSFRTNFAGRICTKTGHSFQVEKYDDPRSDDEDEQDEDRGKKRKHLDGNYSMKGT